MRRLSPFIELDFAFIKIDISRLRQLCCGDEATKLIGIKCELFESLTRSGRNRLALIKGDIDIIESL